MELWCSLWSVPKQTIEIPVIWDAAALIDVTVMVHGCVVPCRRNPSRNWLQAWWSRHYRGCWWRRFEPSNQWGHGHKHHLYRKRLQRCGGTYEKPENALRGSDGRCRGLVDSYGRVRAHNWQIQIWFSHYSIFKFRSIQIQLYLLVGTYSGS